MTPPTSTTLESNPIDHSTPKPLRFLLRRLILLTAITSYALMLIIIILIFLDSTGWTETTGNRVGAAIFCFELSILMLFIFFLGSERWRRRERWGWHWVWDDAGEGHLEGGREGRAWGRMEVQG